MRRLLETIVHGTVGGVPVRLLAVVGVSLAAGLHLAAERWSTPEVPAIDELPAPRRSVAIARVGVEAFQDRLRQLQREGLARSGRRCQRWALSALNLVGPLEPSVRGDRARWPARPGPRFSALYLPGRDTLYVREGHEEAIVHEWVHAIDDQHSGRMERALAAPSLDERLALRAAIEGTAVLATAGATRTRPLQLSGHLDRDASLFLYRIGPPYAAFRSGGDPAAALDLEPSTTHEVLFRLPPVAPISLPAPDTIAGGGSLLCTNRLGAFGVLAAMAQTGAPTEQSLFVARHWRGDRLDLLAGDDGRRVEWTVAFDHPRAVRAWQLSAGAQLPLASRDPSIAVRARLVASARADTLSADHPLHDLLDG